MFKIKYKIPVLLYHQIYTDINNKEKYSIANKTLESHIRYIKEKGYTTILAEDFIDSFSPKKNLVAITFDDGNLSDFSIAFKILQKYNACATFFITTGWIGKEGFVGWEHIRMMNEHGMSIQSHSCTHRILPALSDTEIFNELFDSKSIIEDKLDKPCYFISIPGGFVSKKVLEIAFKVGYKGIFTSRPSLSSIQQKRRIYGRYTITRNTKFINFKSIIEKDISQVVSSSIIYLYKSAIKRLIGDTLYQYIWSKYIKYTE